MNYKVKIITKFRGVNETEYSIPAQEAHKAYYLFFNPDNRTVFSNGVALKGEDIERIVPDFHGTMGWNKTYKLTDDDWNEITSKGIKEKLETIITKASHVAKLDNPKLELPLTEAVKELPQLAYSEDVKKLADKMKM